MSEFDDALDEATGPGCRSCRYGPDHEVTRYIDKWMKRTKNGTTQMGKAELFRWLQTVGYEGKLSSLKRHISECLNGG